MESTSWRYFDSVADIAPFTSHFIVQTATKSFADSGQFPGFLLYIESNVMFPQCIFLAIFSRVSDCHSECVVNTSAIIAAEF